MDTFTSLVTAAGGLGLFLLGMVTLCDGLRELAGASVRSVLQRFTHSPSSGAVTGALATAVVQSSSVTTVTAVGFASAGLLTFPEALGIVFGANIGTTITGWLVAILGFKVQVAYLMPLLVLVGALLRLFSRDRLSVIGTAVAGFGLAFVGIEMLRVGTATFEGVVTPTRFPGDSIPGRLQLVGIGVMFTLLTQSSSAGVATALAAIAAGAIEFGQAAALVIGMDIGTTITAGIASIGASLPGRRTAYAHILYNLMTGVGALFLLPVFGAALEGFRPGILVSQPELALVAFHSTFNTLGVFVILPVATPFARLIERLVPDRAVSFSQRLDRQLMADPEIALRALTPVFLDLYAAALKILKEELSAMKRDEGWTYRIHALRRSLADVERYLAEIPHHAKSLPRRQAALHVVDQLRRLLSREAQVARLETLAKDSRLQDQSRVLLSLLERAEADPSILSVGDLAEFCSRVEAGKARYRDEVTGSVAPSSMEVSEALNRMDAYRWLARVAHHCWRVSHYLGELSKAAAKDIIAPPREPIEADETD